MEGGRGRKGKKVIIIINISMSKKRNISAQNGTHLTEKTRVSLLIPYLIQSSVPNIPSTVIAPPKKLQTIKSASCRTISSLSTVYLPKLPAKRYISSKTVTKQLIPFLSLRRDY